MDRDYRELLARGDAALRDDQTYGAIEAYSGAIALRPDSMLAYLRRGETYQRRGELEAAARDFQAAAALDPTATRPLDELGDVRYLQQRFDRAAETTSGICGSTTAPPQVSYKLALARYRDGNLDAAWRRSMSPCASTIGRPTPITFGVSACAISVGVPRLRRRSNEPWRCPRARFRPGKSWRICTRRWAGGRRDGTTPGHRRPGSRPLEPQIAVGLAHARWSADPRAPARRAGHEELAVLTLGSALERTPDQPLVYRALGRVWLDSRRRATMRSRSTRRWKRSSRVIHSAATSETLTLYGRALLQSGRIDVAERILQQATERYPIEPTAFLFYATAAEQAATSRPPGRR